MSLLKIKPGMSKQTQQLKDNRDRARNLLISFYILLGFTITGIILSLYERNAYYLSDIDQSFYFEESDETFDFFIVAQSIAQFIIGIVTIVFFLMWFRRAYGNLRRLGIVKLRYGDVHTIWSFIVPILNLFRPYQIAKEIYIKTQKSINFYKPLYIPKTEIAFIFAWWMAFLTHTIYGRYTFRKSLRAVTFEDYRELNEIYIISDSIDCFAILITVLFIYKMHAGEKNLQLSYNSTKDIETLGQFRTDDIDANNDPEVS